jgi:hypothetical protein
VILAGGTILRNTPRKTGVDANAMFAKRWHAYALALASLGFWGAVFWAIFLR